MVEKSYQNKRLKKEFVAEFSYSPGLCSNTYRMVVLRKEVSVSKAQQKLFDESPYFFYITNVPNEEQSAEEIVFGANKRCDQENIISQLKGMGTLAAPLHSCYRQVIEGTAFLIWAGANTSIPSNDAVSPCYPTYPVHIHPSLRNIRG